MTEKKEKSKKNMVYSRKCHIPLGEAVITENGEMGLRVKKANSAEIETISLGTLISDIAKVVRT